jgi:hypothetical protein
MNRPDLMALLGERVTVTNKNTPARTWTGKLVAVCDDPSLVIEEDHGERMTLSQSFYVAPLDEKSAPAACSDIGACVATLRDTMANLDAHIERRAQELAQPHIEQALGEVAEAQDERDHWKERFAGLQQERQRQLAPLERRAVTAETAIARARSTVHLNTAANLGGRRVASGPTDYQRGYQACADHVTTALNGATDQQEADRADT